MEWVSVGNKVRDEMSIGRLEAWGRKDTDFVDKAIGGHSALTKIDQRYWEHAEFTYFFLDESDKSNELDQELHRDGAAAV